MGTTTGAYQKSLPYHPPARKRKQPVIIVSKFLWGWISSTGLWVVMTTNYLHPKIKCIDYQRYLCNESCEWCQRNTNVCYSDHSCKSITRTSKFHQVYFPNQMPLTKWNNIFIRRRNNIFIFRFILQTTCTRKNKLS